MNNDAFNEGYNKLNKAQKEAVDTTEGPVMVIAGPGTGKTQVLALRIANIMVKTDTKADGILCLTFTNSGVRAMRERLLSYIGPQAAKVNISTFHSFAGNILEEFYNVIDLPKVPTIMDESTMVSLIDEILENNTWEHLRLRGNSSFFFKDIKSLISLLKREQMSPESFLNSLEVEIENIEHDEASISTRGESKGKLKQDAVKKIAGLERTKEIVEFYKIYEQLKKEKLLADYDDIIGYALEILKQSEDACATLQERYLYVHVDEHQDSSNLQNEILRLIWGEIEKPNIFVVGDDRQLIYGFGGASISYFENFKHTFGKAHLVTLIENYRSTQQILDTADSLLESTLSVGKLKSNTKENYPINLVQASYPRDEILFCAKEIKQKIAEGINPDSCVLLVPKNSQVKNAITVLRDRGLDVSSDGGLSLFEMPETVSLIRILKIIDNPYDSVSICEILFDSLLNIPPLQAHAFLQKKSTYNLSVLDLDNGESNLLSNLDPINILGKDLKNYIEKNKNTGVYEIIQEIGEKMFLDKALNHKELVRRTEVVRTMLHLVLIEQEKIQKHYEVFSLKNFLNFIDRLKSYDQDIPLALFENDKGVKVMTMHSSKGLEFDFVWIAHIDEKTLMHGKRQAFSLPKDVQDKIEEKDELVVKRQLYVALTRAKRFCNFSYSHSNYNGSSLELSSIIANLSQDDLFIKKDYTQTEAQLLEENVGDYVVSHKKGEIEFKISDLTELVRNEYIKTKVSVTMLNNFFECPWKWYFRNLLRLPDVLSESLIFGNVVHGTLEQVLKNDTRSSDDIILEQIHKQHIYDKVLIKRLTLEAKKVITNWTQNRLKEIEKDYISERSVSYRDERFPHLLFYGKIDLTEKVVNGEYKVTDFKTGSVKTKSEIEKNEDNDDGASVHLSSYMRQLAMYSYLIQGAESNSKVVESQLEFLEAKETDKNKIYKTRISQEQIDMLVHDIGEYDKSLANGDWVYRPCQFQTYGKDTECPNCKRAEIYLK